MKISATYKVRQQKIIRFQDRYLGFVGYSAHKNVFESITDKIPGDLNFDGSRHIFETFLRLHPMLKNQFFLNASDDTYKSSDMEIILANPCGIFQVKEDSHVMELEHFWATGSGREFASGAMFQAYDSARTPKEIAVAGVRAATEFDLYSGLPYTVHTVRLRKTPEMVESALI